MPRDGDGRWLRATRCPGRVSKKPAKWELSGGAARASAARFRKTALEAVMALDPVVNKRPVHVWLDAFGAYLIEASSSYTSQEDGATVIRGVIRASADFCMKQTEDHLCDAGGVPNDLLPAVTHIHKLFDDFKWSCSNVTKRLCFAALHPQTSTLVDLAPYEEALPTLFQEAGKSAQETFLSTIARRTPPATFHAYQVLYERAVLGKLAGLFATLFETARNRPDELVGSPDKWATIEVRKAVKRNCQNIHWVKKVCDEPIYVSPGDVSRDDAFHWRSWRAPKLVHMEPSGNTLYDPASAWHREDEVTTSSILESLQQRFDLEIRGKLEELAGQAAARWAISALESDSSEPAKAPHSKPKTPPRKFSKPISKEMLAVLQAIQDGCEGIEYCGRLDVEDVPVPPAWKREGCPRQFVKAYRPRDSNGAYLCRQKIQDRKAKFKARYLPVAEKQGR